MIRVHRGDEPEALRDQRVRALARLWLLWQDAGIDASKPEAIEDFSKKHRDMVREFTLRRFGHGRPIARGESG